MPERFKVVCIMEGAIQVLCFTFTFYTDTTTSRTIAYFYIRLCFLFSSCLDWTYITGLSLPQIILQEMTQDRVDNAYC